MVKSLGGWSQGLAAQWSANPRLRLGVWAIAAILWVYGLLLAADATEATRQQTATLREEMGRVRPLARDAGWAQRAEDAKQAAAAFNALLWTDTDFGLIEARLQDWLRSTATKAGLTVKELSIQRAAPLEGAAPAPAASAVTGPQAIRARVLVEMTRLPLLAFLSELGGSEQVVVVERLALRPTSQPPLAEMDVRVMADRRAASEAKP